MAQEPFGAVSAVDDFYRARRRANLRRVMAQLSGTKDVLLPYEEVRKRLHAVEASAGAREDVPIDRIVGSVGRYNDFTREFLPRNDSDQSRWVGVQRAMTGLEGTPPVELYRIGDAYFVKDGNHRVSVARQLGASTVEAYVIPVHTRVPFSVDDDPDDLILKSEYADFLERTALDEVRPDADLSASAPGAYRELLEHISVHRYFMGIDQDRPVPYQEAVAHWYDTVYLPVVAAIEDAGLLRGFPGRTPTDLYLWLSEHRARLEGELGWELPSEQVAHGVAGGPVVPDARRGEVLDDLVGAAAEGETRGRLADDLLVAFDATPSGRAALEQAMVLARRESARVYGLHVSDSPLDASDEAALRALFERTCEAHRVSGQLAFEVGDASAHIAERAKWVDVAIADFLPGGEAGASRGLPRALRPLLRRCPRPLLAVAGEVSPLQRAMVAFDGGSRAQAALFAGAYTALAWEMQLVVVSVGELGRAADEPLRQARSYLDGFGVTADYVSVLGPVAEGLASTAEERGCDLILMGSYKYNRWLEDVFGGVLEAVLRRVAVPVLVT